MRYKNNEKVIVTIACAITVVIVLGFTLMQGALNSNAEQYVSKQSNTKSEINISKEDYELIKQEEKNKIQTYIVLEKKKFNSDEISQLTKQLVKDTNKKFELYIFDDKEKAKNFDYNKEQVQLLVKPTDQQCIEIQNYYIVKNEIESVPQYYAVESIKEKNKIAHIKLNIEKIEKPEQALSHIKFLGQTIKDLNKDKQIENLEIKAYYKEESDTRWEYTSENKNLIIHNEIVQL